MPYEKAADALVDAGLLDQTDVGTAIAVLVSSSVEMTYPAWAEALARARLLTEVNTEAAIGVMEKAEAAIGVMEKAGTAEAKDLRRV
jgi:hypothetical protein